MAYVFLAGAILAEVLGTSLLKASEGFTRVWPTVVLFAAYGLSFAFLSQAVRGIEVGVVYAVWSGLGTALIVAIGAVYLGEAITVAKVAGVLLIIGGVVMLNLDGVH
jgi:small multidrug resistance pump